MPPAPNASTEEEYDAAAASTPTPSSLPAAEAPMFIIPYFLLPMGVGAGVDDDGTPLPGTWLTTLGREGAAEFKLSISCKRLLFSLEL